MDLSLALSILLLFLPVSLPRFCNVRSADCGYAKLAQWLELTSVARVAPRMPTTTLCPGARSMKLSLSRLSSFVLRMTPLTGRAASSVISALCKHRSTTRSVVLRSEKLRYLNLGKSCSSGAGCEHHERKLLTVLATRKFSTVRFRLRRAKWLRRRFPPPPVHPCRSHRPLSVEQCERMLTPFLLLRSFRPLLKPYPSTTRLVLTCSLTELLAHKSTKVFSTKAMAECRSLSVRSV